MDASLLELVAPVNVPKAVGVMFVINGLMSGVKRIPVVPDWSIALLAPLCGAVLYPLLLGFSGETVFLGLGIGLVSIGSHQGVRQMGKAMAPKTKPETPNQP